MQRGGDVEDLALRFLKFFEGGSADVEGALCVDIDNGAEAVRGKLIGGTKKISGGRR